jgi:hypothetical protein
VRVRQTGVRDVVDESSAAKQRRVPDQGRGLLARLLKPLLPGVCLLDRLGMLEEVIGELL